jgi:hypothetical protein
MRSLRLRKPSPALVIAVIALFIGLGGGAYAAKVGTNQLKAKSVTTGKIAGKAVTSGKIGGKAVKTGKIAGQAVTSGKIGDEAVTTDKLAFEAVTTGELADEAVTTDELGDQAVTTDKLGDQAVTTGKLGLGSVKSGQLGQITVVEQTSPPAAVPQINATANCPAGTRVISGGVQVTAIVPVDPPIITRDRRTNNNGWEANAIAQNAGDTVTAYAYCLESSS